MKIEAFILAFNEAEVIHFTIRHYQRFCHKITVFDNYSTDDTRSIAKSMGCEVRAFGIDGVLDDREYTKLKNNCWKDSKSDYIIVVDCDEILCLPHFLNTDISIYRTLGWNIFSESLPKHDWLDITHGVYDENYSKLVLFNPQKIKEINYVHGCHVANPIGEIVYSNSKCPLFHYKHVGGADRVVQRHALYESRKSDWNKRFKAGYQYSEPAEQTRKYFYDNLAMAKPFEEDINSLVATYSFTKSKS